MWRPYAPTGATSDDDVGDKCRVFACVRPSTKATKDIKPGEKYNNENLVVQSLTFHVSFYFFKHHGELLLQKNVHVCK